jgi:hypothetical protein
MKSNSLLIVLLLLVTITGCGGGGGSSPPKTLVSIAVTPANPRRALETTQQFSATGTFSDNTTQDLTASVTWSSSATSVATISNVVGSNGKATSVAAGTTTITATTGGVLGTTTLTVTSATLVSLSINPTNSSIPLGTAKQFIATGTFSDNSTQDLTTSATWSSSAATVAAISNATGSNGMATAVAVGTTTITATVLITQPIPGSISGSTNLTVTSVPVNVMAITVNGSLCSAATSSGYVNKPCVSVTICTPGTSTCQVVTDILLDTGSYGLRIFKQALSVSLPNSGSLAGCVFFGDGSSEWGPIKMASVILGNEPAVQMPIQVVDATFGTPTGCGTPDVMPSDAGFNGILGVGLLAQDCGAACVSSPDVGMYFTCNGTVCSGTTVPLASQVQNPVAVLTADINGVRDNNGVLVQLPSVPLGGQPSVNGSLILGIGTRPNNSPAAVTAYPANIANHFPEFATTLNGKSFTSFIDSGSNGLFFSATNASLASQLPPCLPLPPNSNAYFYCPSATVPLTAVNTGFPNSPSGTVPFQIGNFNSLTSTSDNVFSELGGNGSGNEFDWGLPFFFGKNVFVGIEGTSSPLSPPGNGPYWAY